MPAPQTPLDRLGGCLLKEEQLRNLKPQQTNLKHLLLGKDDRDRWFVWVNNEEQWIALSTLSTVREHACLVAVGAGAGASWAARSTRRSTSEWN